MDRSYRQPDRPIADRVANLLGQMTLAEKVGQVTQLPGWTSYQRDGESARLREDFLPLLTGSGVGSLYGVLRADPWTGITHANGLTPSAGAEIVNALQRYALDHSRLGIPLLIGMDGSHGSMALGATVFPGALSLASTWNTTLAATLGHAIAAEIRAQGGHITYAPVLDLARDPRWGRTEETMGEDPALCGALGAALVRGLQGQRLSDQASVAATIKHFAAHGAPEGGHNSAPAHVGPHELHAIWLAPFRAAIAAGAQAVMAAYHAIDGVPCTSNAALLTTILREEWGFAGIVTSDMGAIQLLVDGHRVAANQTEAAHLALAAGVDMEMNPTIAGGAYQATLTQLVEDGSIPMATLDRAVRRILLLKFRLGLFEHPFCDAERAPQILRSPAHRQIAYEVACQGTVLLKNTDDLLPLAPTIARIAVIGPNADHVANQLGDYTAPQRREEVITVLDGIRQAVAPATQVRYAPGCRIRGDDTSGFAAAIACARDADVAVVVVGGSSARAYGAAHHDATTGAAQVHDADDGEMESGEGFDRDDLDLAGVQRDLVQAIYATGTPVVVILINGRPVSSPWIADHIPAILEAWYPGVEGGRALADILFGAVNPSGRLPLTIPRSVGQLPASTTRPAHRYVEHEATPLFAFGAGLSYTSFSYADLRVAPAAIAVDGTTQISVSVTNTGQRVGEEVVQLYVRDDVASVVQPEWQLTQWARVTIAPQATQLVTFTLTAADLAICNAQLQQVVEPGTFTVRVGGAGTDRPTVQLTVTREASRDTDAIIVS